MAGTVTEVAGELTSTIKEKAEAVASSLIDLADAPTWMRQDQFIVRAYRRQQNSFRGCFSSLFYIHNETVNIWSHLSVGLFFLGLNVWTCLPSVYGDHQFPKQDLRALRTYFSGATICCLFSAFYHCVSCHSEKVARQYLKLDYLGIVFNITSTCVSATYFGLYEHHSLAGFYITLILACGSAAFWAVLDPSADGHGAASFRAAVFIALGTSGFAPIVHAGLDSGIGLSGFSIEYVLAQSAFYLLGTAVYVNRLPESRWKSKFDVWGASHQIFHILVNVAQFMHLFGLMKALSHHHHLQQS